MRTNNKSYMNCRAIWPPWSFIRIWEGSEKEWCGDGLTAGKPTTLIMHCRIITRLLYLYIMNQMKKKLMKMNMYVQEMNTIKAL